MPLWDLLMKLQLAVKKSCPIKYSIKLNSARFRRKWRDFLRYIFRKDSFSRWVENITHPQAQLLLSWSYDGSLKIVNFPSLKVLFLKCRESSILLKLPECEDNENKKGSSFVEIEHLGHFNCQTGDILVRLYRPARFVSIDKVPTKILG